MRLALDPRLALVFARVPKRWPYMVVIVALMALLSVQAARIIWTVIGPAGPIGNWKAGPVQNGVDESLLTRFDPFFRLGGSTGPAVVTNLAVKLFGVRVNEASGLGSAIIATPDGVQSSFAVGDEIMPGVTLKSVSFDGVTIDRGGVAEQIFLDQSVVAPVAAPAAGAAMDPGVAPPAQPGALANDIAYAPRLEKGQVTGFVVSPKGAGTAFNAAGLKAGDVLTSINGQGIRSVEDVRNAMQATSPSGIVTLAVERGGKAIGLQVRPN
jgi:general secretion pathway protein C